MLVDEDFIQNNPKPPGQVLSIHREKNKLVVTKIQSLTIAELYCISSRRVRLKNIIY